MVDDEANEGGRKGVARIERKGVPVEISRRKLSAAIVRHRLSVRRGRKMRYEMKRRDGVGGGPRGGAGETRVTRTARGWKGKREREEQGFRWYTHQRSAHKASNVYNTEESYRENCFVQPEITAKVFVILRLLSLLSSTWPVIPNATNTPRTMGRFLLAGNLRYAPIFSNVFRSSKPRIFNFALLRAEVSFW